jgi:hypothetical protein
MSLPPLSLPEEGLILSRVGRGAGAPGSRGAEKERPRRGRGAEQKSRGR